MAIEVKNALDVRKKEMFHQNSIAGNAVLHIYENGGNLIPERMSKNLKTMFGIKQICESNVDC
jgi:hypothetical protein